MDFDQISKRFTVRLDLQRKICEHHQLAVLAASNPNINNFEICFNFIFPVWLVRLSQYLNGYQNWFCPEWSCSCIRATQVAQSARIWRVVAGKMYARALDLSI